VRYKLAVYQWIRDSECAEKYDILCYDEDHQLLSIVPLVRNMLVSRVDRMLYAALERYFKTKSTTDVIKYGAKRLGKLSRIWHARYEAFEVDALTLALSGIANPEKALVKPLAIKLVMLNLLRGNSDDRGLQRER